MTVPATSSRSASDAPRPVPHASSRRTTPLTIGRTCASNTTPSSPRADSSSSAATNGASSGSRPAGTSADIDDAMPPIVVGTGQSSAVSRYLEGRRIPVRVTSAADANPPDPRDPRNPRKPRFPAARGRRRDRESPDVTVRRRESRSPPSQRSQAVTSPAASPSQSSNPTLSANSLWRVGWREGSSGHRAMSAAHRDSARMRIIQGGLMGRSTLVVTGMTLMLTFGAGARTLSAQTCSGGTVQVNSTADSDDGTCGPQCTLREAINAANASADCTNITFDFSPAPGGQIVVNSPLPIDHHTRAFPRLVASKLRTHRRGRPGARLPRLHRRREQHRGLRAALHGRGR